MSYKLPTKNEKFFIIAGSLAIIFVFLYLGLRDNSLLDNELSTVYVKLKDNPKYDEYKVKSTTYQDIILTTKEYRRDFKITGFTYKATNHRAFKANIQAGDKVELKIKKSELDHLNDNAFSNSYNDIYGLSKDGIEYVDNELRTELKDKDSRWSYLFVLIGLVMLPYGFIRGKPLIGLKRAVIVTMIIGLIFLLIYIKK
jgi:hypothetical protein